MGLFDMVNADLECPVKKKTGKEQIQIKWSEGRSLRSYKIGDVMDLEKVHKDLWVKEEYVCNQCSKKTKGKYGYFIKVENHRRHDCYIHLKNNVISEILLDKKFQAKAVDPDYFDF
jgi:hypothetical protein